MFGDFHIFWGVAETTIFTLFSTKLAILKHPPPPHKNKMQFVSTIARTTFVFKCPFLCSFHFLYFPIVESCFLSKAKSATFQRKTKTKRNHKRKVKNTQETTPKTLLQTQRTNQQPNKQTQQKTHDKTILHHQ